MRAGPKAEITGPPLDLSHLPRSGVGRVDSFAREHLTVTRGKGARQPCRLPPVAQWKFLLGRDLDSGLSRSSAGLRVIGADGLQGRPAREYARLSRGASGQK